MKVILNNIIFEIIINKIEFNIYRIFIGIEAIFSIISVFINTLITTKGTENTYFIKNKIIIFLFIFIVNKYNYKTEIIGS